MTENQELKAKNEVLRNHCEEYKAEIKQQNMVGESMVVDAEQAGKELAKVTSVFYTALLDEGFTKAQAIHFTDLFLAGIFGRIIG